MAIEDDRPASPSADHEPSRAWQPGSGIADGLVEALDWLEQGIVLLGRDGRVLFASAVAHELLTAERGLAISGGVLQVRSSAEAATLRHLVARCASDLGEGHDASSLLSCRVGEPALLLLVARAARLSAVVRPSGAAILFIVDPSRASRPSADHLRHHFGLTAAEAAVAVDVISGDGLKASARRLGMSLETARTHLRHIFGKTGVRRQAELVRLLLSARHTVREPRRPPLSRPNKQPTA